MSVRRRVTARWARLLLALVLGPALAFGGLGGLGGARAGAEGDDRVGQLHEEIGEASAEEAEALALLDGIRTRRSALDADVLLLDQRVQEAVGQVAAAQRLVDHYTSAALELDQRIEATEARRREAQDRFDDVAAALYRSGGSSVDEYVTLAFATESAREYFSGAVYLGRLSHERQADVEELLAIRGRVERLRTRAERERGRAREAREQAVADGEQLAALRREQASKRDAIAADEARERQVVASIRQRKDAFTAELAVLQATSDGITQMLATLQAGQAQAASFHAARPVPGRVTSRFGSRVHPILGDTRMHNGVDMDADQGSPIAAAADGVVAWAGPRQGYGNTVIVDHGNRYATLYAHASRLLVSVGESVTSGEVVAEIGATGLATGPHLHFEVRLLGVPHDPVTYM